MPEIEDKKNKIEISKKLPVVKKRRKFTKF